MSTLFKPKSQFRRHGAAPSPTPEEIKAARIAFGLTQAKAADLLHSSERSWQDWEAGRRKMHPAFWDLWRAKAKRLHRRRTTKS
jgi:DNA-binding transcriptional regulator YiaG